MSSEPSCASVALAALEWTERIAEKSPAAVGEAVAGVVAHYARTDLDAAASWLNTHRDTPLYDQAAYGFLSASRDTISPASAQNWIQPIRDPALRARTEKMFNIPPNPSAR
jgi:hypothetical protein